MTVFRRIAVAAVLAALLGVLPGRSWADEACQACHSAPGMGNARVTSASLAQSPHKGFACRDCHAGLPAKAVAHSVPTPPVNCLRCHSSRPQRGAKPVPALHHGRKGAPAGQLPRCESCHGTHGIRPAAKLESMVSRQNVVQTCASCHGPKGAAAKQIGSRQVVEYRKSVHGRANPSRPGLYAAVCTECHGDHSILPQPDPASTVHKTRVPATCGKCHAKELQDYTGSIHGKALARGVTDAPSCTDCHGEHKILATGERGSTVYGLRVEETCARCHADKTLIRKYNLPVGRVESYNQSYHGVANRFGEINVANCASCHRAHLILPQSDPRSSINRANLPATCGAPKCHPGAGPNFARGSMHLRPSPRTDKIVFWVTVGYIIFVAGVMASFVVFIILDLIQHYRLAKLGAHAAGSPLDEQMVRRLAPSQLWQHGVLITSFTLLVVSGMPLRFADLPASGWLVRLLGGVTLRGDVHRFFALVLIGVCVWHGLWTPFTRTGRSAVVMMLPQRHEVRRAFGMLKYYLGFSREMPGFGRFNLIEKFEYLAMGWGTVVMVISGFALWAPEMAMRIMPKWGVDICHVVHSYEAMLAFLSIIIWHFYHVHLKPGTFPMSRVWLDGTIKLGELRHEHGLEYQRMLAELSTEAPAPEPQPEAKAESEPAPEPMPEAKPEPESTDKQPEVQKPAGEEEKPQ